MLVCTMKYEKIADAITIKTKLDTSRTVSTKQLIELGNVMTAQDRA